MVSNNIVQKFNEAVRAGSASTVAEILKGGDRSSISSDILQSALVEARQSGKNEVVAIIEAHMGIVADVKSKPTEKFVSTQDKSADTKKNNYDNSIILNLKNAVISGDLKALSKLLETEEAAQMSDDDKVELAKAAVQEKNLVGATFIMSSLPEARMKEVAQTVKKSIKPTSNKKTKEKFAPQLETQEEEKYSQLQVQSKVNEAKQEVPVENQEQPSVNQPEPKQNQAEGFRRRKLDVDMVMIATLLQSARSSHRHPEFDLFRQFNSFLEAREESHSRTIMIENILSNSRSTSQLMDLHPRLASRVSNQSNNNFR